MTALDTRIKYTKIRFLHVLAKKGYYDIAKCLIDKGADIEATDEELQCTPLHIAAENGHTNFARLLIEKGCNINNLNKNFATPLHYAIKYNQTKMIELLLQNGAKM